MKKKNVMIITAAVLVCAITITGIARAVRGGGSAVDVTQVSYLNSGWWDEGTSTSGYVTANASQDVYLESDSVVEKVYVKKGDKVKIGDTLLEYDKTLLQLNLEEEQINKQIQELELQGAKNDLEKLKKITPVPDSEGGSSGVSPLDEPDDSSDDLDDSGADGYEEARAAIVKHNVSLVSTAVGADVQVIDGNSDGSDSTGTAGGETTHDFENYREVLKLMDYVLLNNRKIAIDKAKIYFGKLFPNISLCAGNIDTMEDFERLKETGGYRFYEGKFYRVPITKGQTDVAPLKGNYIDLLNIVNSPDFELTTAADIISRDTALTIDLLKMVQPLAVNSEITSIRHAAAMLGQRELKKWINTAVANALYADKPNEVTRLSLLRAKFAENLAEAFGLKAQKDELFLMGLFSVLDVILEKPMAEALKVVHVAGEISNALIYRIGVLAPVYDFMLQYETANWAEVSRLMLLKNIDMNTVYEAYTSALKWYRTVR